MQGSTVVRAAVNLEAEGPIAKDAAPLRGDGDQLLTHGLLHRWVRSKTGAAGFETAVPPAPLDDINRDRLSGHRAWPRFAQWQPG